LHLLQLMHGQCGRGQGYPHSRCRNCRVPGQQRQLLLLPEVLLHLLLLVLQQQRLRTCCRC
jgi:hypothetical protein